MTAPFSVSSAKPHLLKTVCGFSFTTTDTLTPETPPQRAAQFLNQSVITTLQALVIAMGADLGMWGGINLLEGCGNNNPGANAHVS